MRPMWLEFPDSDSLFQKMETQFMLGDAMLVAPKIMIPSKDLDA